MTKNGNLDTSRFPGEGDHCAPGGTLPGTEKKELPRLSEKQRMLFIGLGDPGAEVLEQLKRNIQSRFSDWQRSVGFLAVDMNARQLNSLQWLAESEKYLLAFQPGANERYNDPQKRSEFAKSRISPDFHADLNVWDMYQPRQIAMACLFDEGPDGHNDTKLMEAIRAAAGKMTAGYDPSSMQLSVHIVTGTGDCTGSGLAVQAAHLVRRAISENHRICEYVFLPDVSEQPVTEDPVARYRCRQNGLAALKELDYYCSLFQRTDAEPFEMSDPALGTIYFDLDRPLFDAVYLIGGADKGRAVTGALAEYLSAVSWQGKDSIGPAETARLRPFLWDAAYTNASRSERLTALYAADGSEKGDYDCGEDSFCFNAFGISTAAFPADWVRCSIADRIMHMLPAEKDKSSTAEDSLPAHGSLTLEEAGAWMNRLLAYPPARIEKYILRLCNIVLRWPRRFTPLTRREILRGREEKLRADMVLCDPARLEKLALLIDRVIAHAAKHRRRVLREFLATYGPRAYMSLYGGFASDGRACPRALCERIRECQVMSTPYTPAFIDRSAAEQKKNEAYTAVSRDLLGRKQVVEEWHEAYRRSEVARVASHFADYVFCDVRCAFEEFARCVLGNDRPAGSFSPAPSYSRHLPNGYTREYLDPSREEAHALPRFCDGIDSLAREYTQTAEKLYAQELANGNVMLCSAEDRLWVQSVMERHIASLDLARIRKELIDCVLSEPGKWSSCDPDKTMEATRRVLDTVLAPYTDTGDSFTLPAWFAARCAGPDALLPTVTDIVQSMALAAAPLYTADERSAVRNSRGRSFLTVPPALFRQDKVPGLRACLAEVCRDNNIALCLSDRADTLTFITLHAALPLYALRDLKLWQEAYDQYPDTMLHMNESRKGDFAPAAGLAWENYPAPALQRDPRHPDKNGVISREGQFLLRELDPLFRVCLDCGIIVREQDETGGYYYSYRRLDQNGWDLSFDIHAYKAWCKNRPGRAIAYFAEKNGFSADHITQRIELKNQGAFNAPVADAALALERARRTVRRNVPMYLSLKKTLAVIRPTFMCPGDEKEHIVL